MWQETKHGLYRQFNFEDFKEAWQFMTRVADLAEKFQHHPRWENEWNVVQIWLITHDGEEKITDKDREMAALIDAIFDPDKAGASPATPFPDSVKVFADGGSRGNPGPSASAFIITDKEDNILLDRGIYLGITTNNQAEYTGLKLALEECLKNNVKNADVFMDSLLVINQVRGTYKIKNRDLWPLHDTVEQLSQKFSHISFSHVPRELNKLADAAVNRTLDEQAEQEQVLAES